MPLLPGKGKRTLADNIEELMTSYKSKGTIGTSIPKSKSAAERQAIAISYRKQKDKL